MLITSHKDKGVVKYKIFSCFYIFTYFLTSSFILTSHVERVCVFCMCEREIESVCMCVCVLKCVYADNCCSTKMTVKPQNLPLTHTHSLAYLKNCHYVGPHPPSLPWIETGILRVNYAPWERDPHGVRLTLCYIFGRSIETIVSSKTWSFGTTKFSFAIPRQIVKVE